MDKIEKARNFIKDNLSKFIIVLIAISYIAQGAFELVQRTWDTSAFLGRLGSSIICGMTIYTNMRISGLRDGRKTAEFLASMTVYAETKLKLLKVKNYMLNAFCIYKNKQNLEEAREEFCSLNGIDYVLWKKGVYDTNEALRSSLTKDQLKTLDDLKTKKFKHTQITTKYILSDTPRTKRKDGRDYDEKDYIRNNTIKDVLSMLLWSAIFSGYVLVPIINGDSWATLLWNTWQILCWLGFGISKYMDSKNFMVNDYRQSHLIYKTELMEEFLSIMEHNPSLLDKYDFIGRAIKEEQEQERLKEESEKGETQEWETQHTTITSTN